MAWTRGQRRISRIAESQPFHHYRPDENPGQRIDANNAATHGADLAESHAGYPFRVHPENEIGTITDSLNKTMGQVFILDMFFHG